MGYDGQMALSLSDVLAGGEDSTFQQLAHGRDLLAGLEFPDTLSQLPPTPEKHRNDLRLNAQGTSSVSNDLLRLCQLE